jgi:hypothetical protein
MTAKLGFQTKIDCNMPRDIILTRWKHEKNATKEAWREIIGQQPFDDEEEYHWTDEKVSRLTSSSGSGRKRTRQTAWPRDLPPREARKVRVGLPPVLLMDHQAIRSLPVQAH